MLRFTAFSVTWVSTYVAFRTEDVNCSAAGGKEQMASRFCSFALNDLVHATRNLADIMFITYSHDRTDPPGSISVTSQK
jgi:hypothetical protein